MKLKDWATVTCKTYDKGKREKSRISCRCRDTDKNCPAEKSWPNHVRNEQLIGSKKTYGPQNKYSVDSLK